MVFNDATQMALQPLLTNAAFIGTVPVQKAAAV